MTRPPRTPLLALAATLAAGAVPLAAAAPITEFARNESVDLVTERQSERSTRV